MASAGIQMGMARMTPCYNRKKAEAPRDEQKLRKVFICSPFHPVGETKAEIEEDLKQNLERAKLACRAALDRGYVPYAPHLYFPQFLSEDDADEREMGIILGLTWLARCDELWVIGTRISEGMKKELAMAHEWGIPIKFMLMVKADGERKVRIYGEY